MDDNEVIESFKESQKIKEEQRLEKKKNVVKMTTGEKIKYYRNLVKMSQKKLAELSGISETSIVKYENGSRKPKLEQLQSIAKSLGLDEMLFWDISIDSPGRLMSLLFLLNEHFDMEIMGNRTDEGLLNIAHPISISFNDYEVAARLSGWDTIKTTYENISRENCSSVAEYELLRSTVLEKYEQAKVFLTQKESIVDSQSSDS